MKIRNGFVSNSSSSSFMIYGACLDKSEVVELLSDDLTKESPEINERELGEVLSEKFAHGEDDVFFAEYDADCNLFYIGGRLDLMLMSETRAEFQARIDRAIFKKFGKQLRCDMQVAQIYR